MSYVIAIPTYNRSDTIFSKTISLLLSRGIQSEKIYLFVANQEEYDSYVKSVPITAYNKIVIGEKGIAKQRNFIRNWFDEGQCVVSIDDDVTDISTFNETKLIPITNLDHLFINCFDVIKQHGLFIWGVSPVKFPLFLKHYYTLNLRFLIGVLHGYIVRHDNDLNVECEGKEDYEQSILYYKKDGGVVRFVDLCFKTLFKSKGGLGRDRQQMNENACIYLCDRYPEYIMRHLTRNGEVTIRRDNRKAKIERPFIYHSLDANKLPQ